MEENWLRSQNTNFLTGVSEYVRPVVVKSVRERFPSPQFETSGSSQFSERLREGYFIDRKEALKIGVKWGNRHGQH
jgi:hypothetical protein